MAAFNLISAFITLPSVPPPFMKKIIGIGFSVVQTHHLYQIELHLFHVPCIQIWKRIKYKITRTIRRLKGTDFVFHLQTKKIRAYIRIYLGTITLLQSLSDENVGFPWNNIDTYKHTSVISPFIRKANVRIRKRLVGISIW